MFEIEYGSSGEVICRGRLDAAQCETAEGFMSGLEGPSTLDFNELEYISSAGLINVNNHIHDVFRYSGFHAIFDIQAKE